MSELQIDFAIPLPQPFVFLAVLGLCILACATAIHHFGRLKGVIIWLWSLHDHTGVKIFMGIGAILAPFWLALLVFTLSGTFGLWTNLPENIPPNAPDGAGLAYRIHYLALVGLTGSLVALVGAPLALLRVHTVERQTKAQEEGLVTERINKAVENLGAVRSVWVAGDDGDGCDRTEPNMEVRVGAIYALERIAQDSPRDHIQIMEILCAYVRQNAPASSAPDLPDAPQWFEGKNEDGETFDQKISTWQGEHAAKLADYSAPIDIQTAVTVIGRRSPEEIRKQEWGAWQPYSEMVGWYPAHPTDATEKELKSYHEAIESWEKKVSQWQRLAPIFRLDLRATNLTALDASARGKSADWSHALFTGAKVQRANFGNAQLQEADFENAQVQRAYFGNAQVQRANFGNAQAQGANFGNAQLQGAYFGNAQVQRANFGNAQLQGAYFTNAQAQGADFRSAIFSTTTRFTRAEFLSALVAGTDFSMVSLTQEQVNAAFGDSSTKLSTGLSRPERHWPKWEMDLPTVYAQWEKYKTDPKSYVPPSPPDQSSDKPA